MEVEQEAEERECKLLSRCVQNKQKTRGDSEKNRVELKQRREERAAKTKKLWRSAS